MAKVVVEINGDEGPYCDVTPDEGCVVTYQFNWRGLFELIFKYNRNIDIGVYMLDEETAPAPRPGVASVQGGEDAT